MAEAVKLTEKTLAVYEYIKANGGSAKTTDIKEALGLEKIAQVTGCVTSLTKKGLATRVSEKEGDKEVTYVILTDEGMGFVPSED